MSVTSDESGNDAEDADGASIGITTRRRVQNAQFEALLYKRADPSSEPIQAPASSLPDAQLSTAHLLARHDAETGHLDPREYQVELFERAKSRNTIAVLDTGSGKTLIAVLLLKHTIQNELVDRGTGKAHRVSFFLVDSVTLVYQQAAVLRNNLDQNVAQFFGAMGTDLWSKQTWEDHLKNNMVIVCTAQILNQCLLNSHIKMEQINLLIFDEAHHTKKEHPYARIIKDSYLKEIPSKRPRVFGMTASPIDAKGDVVEAARMLETLLDSQIATTSKLTLLRHVVRRPTEKVWQYDKVVPPFATALHKLLKDRYGDISCFEGIFKFSWNASSELGRWCSDRIWTLALADDVLPKYEGSINKLYYDKDPEQKSEKAYKDVSRIKEASEFVKQLASSDPHGAEELSPKVQLLKQEIQKYFERPTETKCIVFTQERYTAKILCELFTQLKMPHLKPGVLVGVRSSDIGGMNTTFRQQFLTLISFRNGDINCLFATSVAEEGLDIPDCNLVVRFDLYHTLIQYVQSRGRARHYNSTYATIIEKSNSEHTYRLEEVRRAEDIMQKFCESLPEDRILHGYDYDIDSIIHKDGEKRIYQIPSTGAKLTYHSAIAILARYASSLQYEKETSAQVTYIVLPANSSFTCEVILPEKSPIRGLIGTPAIKKSLAKQSAAFDTCLLLRQHRLLDDYFASVYHKRLPAMRNARLAITSKQKNQYDMITKPEFWKQHREVVPEVLFITVISFIPTRTPAREHQSFALLTRERLPHCPQFPIFLEDDIETNVKFLPILDALAVSTDQLNVLTTFSLRVFRDVFHKIYDRNTEKMPYWLCPVVAEDCFEPASNPKDVIDWHLLMFVQDNDAVEWSCGMATELLHNRFVYDPWDGRYRYFTQVVDPNLRASDPPPSFVQRRRHMDNILNFCTSLSKNGRARFMATCDWDQPVIRAELIRLRRNLLDKMTDAEKDFEARSVICPEPLKISAIPASLAASCLAFPAIISRLDSYLIAVEACDHLGLVIELEHALEALTKDSDNTEEHRGQQIHFQRGMGKNYERLEFLGDCFLKMATSIALFSQNPDDDEFDYHVNRMCLICNKNLFNSAIEKRLYEFIRSRGFSRHAWYPDGLTLLQGKDHSKKTSSESKHALAEKTIADVCEALIGASLLSGGPQHRFDMAVKAVSTFVGSASHKVTSWHEYYELYSLPKYQTQGADGFELDLAQKVEEKLGYRFAYPRLLRSAFTHPSYPSAWAKVPCYQRLEFLGDSLLDMVCVEDLYHRFPDRDPQWLTEHKMAMVSNKFLGYLAVKLQLHTHLQHFSNPLQSQITHYAEDIQTAEIEHKQAVDFWVVTKDPPKCLPDMVEAFLGAAFVDSNFNFQVVEDFFHRHIKVHFEDMSIYDTFANKHPTTFLHNRLTNEYNCTNYCLKSGEIPGIDGLPPTILAAVIVHDTVVAEGTASSGRYAKVKASENALSVLEGLPAFEFRNKYHCNCQETDSKAPEIGTAI
ncbi:hypothetical protein ASPZODRAFT_155932 [Penicilliopsis zonata CBS 506.65]|uniref:Dicer-like protein 1 n=1 Tax=Penicilliopsis zonata CBS 506.65 TaxID=1073090 RepID=A0A1L9SV25_9EURO|nr:hypothetical protein ASPZODRAFT_155932 [Penicilliopsis zonata CBS 506.65]OJJ50927.1 hypothetical protein ASPZODRAFT_155932 [Penicilliopsis zonata CBS 506.65]